MFFVKDHLSQKNITADGESLAKVLLSLDRHCDSGENPRLLHYLYPDKPFPTHRGKLFSVVYFPKHHGKLFSVVYIPTHHGKLFSVVYFPTHHGKLLSVVYFPTHHGKLFSVVYFPEFHFTICPL